MLIAVIDIKLKKDLFKFFVCVLQLTGKIKEK